MKTSKSLGKNCAIALLAGVLLLTGCKKNSDDSTNPTSGSIVLASPPFYNASASSSYLAPTDLFVDSKDNKWLVSNSPMGAYVLKYNGTTWEKFTASNIPVPLKEYIAVHTEDSEGGVYFTTEDGNGYTRYLVKYKAGTWSYWNITNAVYADKIFFNTADNQLYFYSDDVIKKAALTSNFASSSSYTTVTSNAVPYSMFMDGSLATGSFYLTSGNKSIRVSSTGSVQNLTSLENSLSFRSLASSSNGSVYATVSSSGDKIYRLSGTTWNMVPYTNGSIANTLISQYAIDNSDNIIVNALDYAGSNTEEQGVGRIVNGAIKYYKLNNERILTAAPIAIDKNNAKWIAVFSGLVKISD